MYLTPLCCFSCIPEYKALRIPKERTKMLQLVTHLISFVFYCCLLRIALNLSQQRHKTWCFFFEHGHFFLGKNLPKGAYIANLSTTDHLFSSCMKCFYGAISRNGFLMNRKLNKVQFAVNSELYPRPIGNLVFSLPLDNIATLKQKCSYKIHLPKTFQTKQLRLSVQ